MLSTSACFRVSLLAVIVVLAASPLYAATSAYWRHEEGPAGALIPDGPDTVLDSSGNGNHMKTYSSGFEPFTAATYVSVVSPLPLRSGLPNTLSLDFGPSPAQGTEDGNGKNDDNYSEGAALNNQLFNELTVEVSFRMNSLTEFQALVGKDGKPLGDAPGEDDRPVPPLKIMVRGDNFPDAIQNQLFVEWVDGDGTLASDIHFLAGGETIAVDQWYHVAFTLTANNAELWVAKETGPYELRDAISGADFAGVAGNVLVEDPTNWSIGRGMWNNGVADWSDAIIDEVRVSDAALTSDQFLFIAGDSPSENADFDGDGDIDGADFLAWQRGVGIDDGSANLANGDANDDGNVTDADLTIWKDQFGAPAAAAVPEPATWLLSVAALSALVSARRKRRHATVIA